MNKIMFGSLIATVVLLLGIIYTLTETIKSEPAPLEVELAKWTITCNPTYGSVLKYEHFGSKPIPDILNNLSLVNEYGGLYTLHNMNNCVIMRATPPLRIPSSLTTPQVEKQNNSVQQPPKGTTV